MTDRPEHTGIHVKEDRLPGEPTVFPLDREGAQWLAHGFRDNLDDGGVSFFVDVKTPEGTSRMSITPDRIEEADDALHLYGHNTAYTFTITLPNDELTEPTISRGVRQHLDGANGVIPHSTAAYETKTMKIKAIADDGLPLL
jgi:hypothetical protein